MDTIPSIPRQRDAVVLIWKTRSNNDYCHESRPRSGLALPPRSLASNRVGPYKELTFLVSCLFDELHLTRLKKIPMTAARANIGQAEEYGA